MVNLLKQLVCKNELKRIADMLNTINTQKQTINDLQNENSALKQENETLKSANNITEPPVLGTITFQEVYNILRQLTPIVFISDSYFKTTSMEEARKFCINTKVWTKKWVLEDHDCDDFSFAMQGYWHQGLYSFAFGIMWSETHAFNFLIDNNKQLWIVEPQNNNFYTLEQAKNIRLPDGSGYLPIRFAML